MCRTPPHDRQQYRSRLTAGRHTLGIPQLDRETDLSGLRPEIPLSELTADRLDRLLALISHWITDVRAHAADPETTTEKQHFAHTKPPQCASISSPVLTGRAAQIRVVLEFAGRCDQETGSADARAAWFPGTWDAAASGLGWRRPRFLATTRSNARSGSRAVMRVSSLASWPTR